jgi:phosphoribosylformylglycinamidine synthase
MDLARERAVQAVCLEAIRSGIVHSAHDCADGGLAVALAECCMTGPGTPLGARLEIPGDFRADARLFGESASRIILSVRPADVEQVEQIARARSVPCRRLGDVGGDLLVLQGQGVSIALPIGTVHHAWSTGLSRFGE